jgi:hypothetical protein
MEWLFVLLFAVIVGPALGNLHKQIDKDTDRH